MNARAADPDTKADPTKIAGSVQRGTAGRKRRFSGYLSLDDFEHAAARKLPRMVWGYVDGAVETGAGKSGARAAWDRFALIPGVLNDVTQRQQKQTLFGNEWSTPFGIAPLGGAAMVGYRADLAMARAARQANIPMILSASSLIPLEEVATANPEIWFQAYLAGDMIRIEAMVDRVAAAGVKTLVVTADTPVPGNRENNQRSGFSMPMRITPRVAIDSALHPRWLLDTIGQTFVRHGIPHFENMDAARGPAMFSQNSVRNMNNRDRLSWDHVAGIRDRWKGRLVIKGILSPSDAARARDLGADGIIVSNHGGRQLDYACPPALALPGIKARSGGMAVMIDGGIRRGTDVIKALALGADFAFLGRPFLYAAAMGQAEGVGHAAELLAAEVDRDMALLGVNDLAGITSEMICAQTSI